MAWLSAALIGATRIGIWNADLLKPTVLWLLLTGFGLLFRLTDAIDQPTFFRRAVLRTVGAVALFEYVANLTSFALWIEIPTQALAVPCGLVAFAGNNSEHLPARKLANAYLSLLGLSAVGWTVWRVVSERSEADFEALWLELLLPVWLTPMALLYVYSVAIWAAYERTLRQVRFTAEGGKLFGQQLAVVLRSAGRLSVLRVLRSRSWHLGRANGFREAWVAVREVILEERRRVAAEEAKQRRLVENAGRVGVDASGRQLDQREHDQTKETLRTLANWQFGHYRRHGDRYQTNLEVEALAERNGLPTPSGIHIHVDSGGHRWYAERRTVTGHWFAIGASGPPTDQWMYDGCQPPAGFPNESEWDQWYGHTNAPNWD